MFRFSGLYILFFCASIFFAKAQQSSISAKSNSSRLNIDFEIKDNINPDITLLNSISLDNYEKFRKNDKRIFINDAATGFVLVLYSQIETDINRANLSPLQKAPIINNKQEKAIK